MLDLARWRMELLHDITRLDWPRLDIPTGLRAGAFVITPLIVGAATGYLIEGLFATLAANFLTNTEGNPPSATGTKILAAACILEPSALAVGTLTGTTGQLLIPLVGLGVFMLLMARAYPSWALVATISAIFFVVGTGLPGDSVAGAFERFWSSMIGAFWALLGVMIQRWLTAHRSRSGSKGPPPQTMAQASRHLHPFMSDFSIHSETFRQALLTGMAAAVGLAIGLLLNLPRDIWILITVIITIRPSVGPTINSAIILVVGTVAGAMIAAAVTLALASVDILGGLLFVFAFAMFSFRLVNQALYQMFLTPFLIILLNLIFPGSWWFALARIADVAVGGGVAIATVYLLMLGTRSYGRRRASEGK
ncbi:MAG: FUSC family protein [Thaumarchaeota archaeon]|nr:FUSC family protein [Nitrososphaerota archaeon]